MKKDWVKRIVMAVLALAMVAGVCLLAGEKGADADVVSTSATVNNSAGPVTVDLAFNQPYTLTGRWTQIAPINPVSVSWNHISGTSVTPVSPSAFGSKSITGATYMDAFQIQAGTTTGTTVIEFSVTDGVYATSIVTVNLVVHDLEYNSSLSIVAKQTGDPSLQYRAGGTATPLYNVTIVPPTGIVSVTSDYKIQGLKAGTATVTFTNNAMPSQVATVNVTVSDILTTMTVAVPSSTTMANPFKMDINKSFTATVTTIPTDFQGQITWTVVGGGVTATAIGTSNQKTATILAGSAATGPVQVHVHADGLGVYKDADADFYVQVGVPAQVNVSKTAVSMSTLGNDNTILASVGAGGGDLEVSSSNPSIVNISGLPYAPGTTSATLQLVAGSTPGYAVITVSGSTTSTTRTIMVTVGAPARPVITLTPGTATLGNGSSQVLNVDVTNPVPSSDGNYYVKLTLQNRRVYLTDYNYTHPSTYVYWVRLDASGHGTVTVNPQYNGSVRVTAEATNATAARATFTVNGSQYSTLPQTGQDFTLVYVLGVCCLLAAATWVTLYARNKKRAVAA